MKQPGFYSRIGMTPGKLAAVIALSILLIVVVLSQFSASPNVVLKSRKKQVTGSVPAVKQTRFRSRAVGESKEKNPGSTSGKNENGSSNSKSGARHGTHFSTNSRRVSRSPFRTSRIEVREDSKSSAEEVDRDNLAQPAAEWPTISLQEMTDRNPFRMPVEIERLKRMKLEKERNRELAELQAKRELAKQRQAIRVQQAIKRLRQEGVSLVFISGSERVARIGERNFRVDDSFEGLRITEIRKNGSVILDVLAFEE